MASHGSRSPSPPPTPSSRRMKSCARRCERGLCTLATYFPLAFIYSLTTWAVWVDARIGFHKDRADQQIPYSKTVPSTIGVILYMLANASYTVAVFTDPGSPTASHPSKGRGKYSILPTSEPHDSGDVQTITVSSSGRARYCKKCHVSKPDRAHHCSTCKRCVLKMDHHCPWLATCLGLHNYKAFVLFLTYLSLFCWACFLNTAYWVWKEVFQVNNKYLDAFAPVNVILLAVLSGIIGLVLTGFTGWHIYLSLRGQTTIECLEKTRYLSGVRRQVEANRKENATHSRNTSESLTANLKRFGDQVLEFHANAVPGASRFEEGEEHTSPLPSERRFFEVSSNMDETLNSSMSTPPSSNMNRYGPPRPSSHGSQYQEADSPAQRALRSTYQDYEHQRESDRYEEYLLEQESSKFPNAFDLGWRRNLQHIFGPNPLLWWLPICNTTGDGWRWEVSEKWAQAVEEASRKREERLRSQANNTSHQQYTGKIRGGGGGASNENRTGRYYNNNNKTRNNHTNNDDDHHSALSLHTLKHHRSGGKMKRDFDTSAEGEIEAFEVSGSEDEDDEEQDRSFNYHENEDEDEDYDNDEDDGNGHGSRQGHSKSRSRRSERESSAGGGVGGAGGGVRGGGGGGSGGEGNTEESGTWTRRW